MKYSYQRHACGAMNISMYRYMSSLKAILMAAFLLLATTPSPAQMVVDTFATASSGSMVSPIANLQSRQTVVVYQPAELAAVGIVPGVSIYGLGYYKTNSADLGPNATASFEVKVRGGNQDTVISSMWTTYSWSYYVNNFLGGGFTSLTQFVNGINLNIPSTPGWIPFMLDAPFVYTGGALEFFTTWTASANAFTSVPFWGVDASPSQYVYLESNTPLPWSHGYIQRPATIIFHSENPAPCTGIPTGGYISGANLVCPNDSFYLFLVNPSAGPGVTYQWQNAPVGSSTWTNISGATAPSLHYISATPMQFRCLVSCLNSGQTTPSSPYTFTPVAVQIDSISINVNGNIADLEANVSNATSSTFYKWRFGDGDSSGNNPVQHQYLTDSTYTVQVIAVGDCNSDTAYITFTLGCIGGASFHNQITSLTDTNICEGEFITLQTTTSPPPGFTFQWQYRGSFGVFYNIPGATTQTFTVQPTGTTIYRLLATCTTTGNTKISNEITVNVTPPPNADTIHAINVSGNHWDFSAPGASNVTDYQWDFGNGHTSSLSNPSHHFPWAGAYTITLITTNAINGCTDTASLTLNIATHVEELIGSSIDFFPNPATDHIIISTDGLNGQIAMLLTDPAGRTVANLYTGPATGLNRKLSLPVVAPGIYFLQIQSGQQSIRKRLVIR